MRDLFKILGRIKDHPILIVMGLAFGVSALGSRIPFLYDDFVKLMYARGHLLDPLSMFNPHAFPPFRPVVHLFYQINYRLFGITNYAGYHLSLALVHSLNGLLVYLIGSLVSRERRLGFVAAMLFAVFPSNLWSIWWISNVENALTLTLFLSSFYFFIRWTREKKGTLVALTFLLAFLSFLAKMAATLPFILLAYILIYKDEVSLTRRSSRVVISAMFAITLLSYVIPRAIRAGSGIFKDDFATMYFKLTSEYGVLVQGVGRHIWDNFLSYFSTLFMFDKFTHPQMPFQTFFILGGVTILFLLLFLNLLDRTERSRPTLYLLFSLICVGASYFISSSLSLKLISLSFFVYWFIFGIKIERFSVAWLFIVIVPYLFFRPAYFAESRYLYFPNVGLTLLLGSVVLRTVKQISIKFGPHISERLTRGWLFITIGLSFALLTAIYGYDKYLDTLSIGKLEEIVHRSIYEEVPLDGKVVTINMPQSLGFKQWQLEGMGRYDIRFDIFRTAEPGAFLLGDVYFIDYRPLQLEGTDELLRDLQYEAEIKKDISAIRLNVKIFYNIKGVKFNNGTEEFYRLRPGEKLTGFVAPNKGGKKRLIISCLDFPEIRYGLFPLAVEVTGSHRLALIIEAKDAQGITSFVSETHFGGGVNKIEIVNSSENSDIFISGISLQEVDKKVIEASFSETEHIKQMYKDLSPKLSFRARNEAEWRQWRMELRAKLIELLGEFPEKSQLNGFTVKVEDKGDYVREKVVYQSEEGVSVPAYLLIPKKVEFPRPAVIALHGRGPGKDEVVGIRDTSYTSDFGLRLVKKGYVVIAPDARGFGERATGDREPKESLEMMLLGRTMMGMKTWDVMRTVDYLLTRPEVDGEKIGCVGFSMGGVITLFAAALDDRIRVAVASGSFCAYGSAFIGTEVGGPWMIVPGILKYAEISDIAGLIAPRPLLVEAGDQDEGFPLGGALTAFHKLQQIYRFLGAEDKLAMDIFSGGHRFNGVKAYPWLERWLYPSVEAYGERGGKR